MSNSREEQNKKPTAKRSPSILVTDVRSQASRRSSAPFAGAAQNSRFSKKQQRSRSSQEQIKAAHNSKFSNISVSNILSNASEIPSALRRSYPNQLDGSLPLFNSQITSSDRRSPSRSGLSNRRSLKTPQDRAFLPQLIQSLPPRTSKTSQKLVYIPEDDDDNSDDETAPGRPQLVPESPVSTEDKNMFMAPPFNKRGKPVSAKLQQQRQRQPPKFQSKRTLREAKAEIKNFTRTKEDLSRVTAYLVSDSLNLEKASAFLKKTHKVSPRLYDEVLYIPYQLPLLDGTNGYRVRSNIYTKNAVGRASVEDYLDKSEQRDYHFEYFSGQENEELMKNETEILNQYSEESSKDREISSSDNNSNNYASDFKNNDEDSFDPYEPQYFNYKEPSSLSNEMASSILQAAHGEVFLFNYGVIVFWNFTKYQEENILADLSFSRYSDEDEDDILINEIHEQDIETEEFHFEYDKTTNVPRIYNDMITLKTEDHLIKMTISHAIAQSTKLCRFESRMSEVLYSVSKFPKILALTGQLGISREQLLKKSGKLFKLRVDVNLSSNVLDIPEFFWSFEPSLNPLYVAARDYLEIEERVEVINDRCKVFLEFIDVISESIAENNMNKITWVIIVIIIMSLTVSILEIFVRYQILTRSSKK